MAKRKIIYVFDLNHECIEIAGSVNDLIGWIKKTEGLDVPANSLYGNINQESCWKKKYYFSYHPVLFVSLPSESILDSE